MASLRLSSWSLSSCLLMLVMTLCKLASGTLGRILATTQPTVAFSDP